MSAAPPHVAVVGGGFAGLAAAVRLARGGARVTLLERRPFLGGRAYSFTDPASGDVIDNGPHALMGAYTAALDFLGEIGAASKLAFQPLPGFTFNPNFVRSTTREAKDPIVSKAPVVVGPTRDSASWAIAACCAASHSAFVSYEVTSYIGPASRGGPLAR